MGFMFNDFFFAFHLLGLISRSSELKNVIVAVTQNGKTLLLTGLLGCVVVYLFSIVGFVAFHDHFEHSCDTLSQCVVHILTTGLRQGGGIGDQMSTIKFGEPMYVYRTVFDFFFWAIMIVIFLNILFGIIIDTFAELRDEKNKKEEDMKTRCTICGIDSYTFDRYGSGFREHTKEEHNMWTYLYFLHHLKKKEPTEYNGQESHVAECVANGDISFFPAGKCSSLKNMPVTSGSSGGDEDNESADSGRSGPAELSGASLKETQNLLASSISSSSDMTMAMLQKILTKLEAQQAQGEGPRITPQQSVTRRGVSGEDAPRSAEVVRLENLNQNLTRQVFEMERSHAHELEHAQSVHLAATSRVASALFDGVDRFIVHLGLLATMEGLATRTKMELFFNAVSAKVHALALQAPAPPYAAVAAATHAAASVGNGNSAEDPLMRDGQEVMKLLRMTIREARAAISVKPEEDQTRKNSVS
jgi:hypothetical protein